jgi:hypothetical protein
MGTYRSERTSGDERSREEQTSGDERSREEKTAQRTERGSDNETVTDQPGVPDEAREAPQHLDVRVERGNPSPEELAALIAVVGSAAGGPTEASIPERNMWGNPVEKLRYPKFSWQRVTLLERTYIRR